MPAAAIHYFSGTGNTYRAVRIVEERLKRTGLKVDLYRVSESLEPPRRPYALHVFAFPVYGLDMPHIMLRYMQQLSRDKARTAVIAVFGDFKVEHWANGYEGNALARATKLLQSKGYNVIFTDAVGYPQSITSGLNPPEPADQAAIRERSDRKVEAMAEMIATDRHSFRKVSRFSPLYGAIGSLFMAVGRRSIGKVYTADERCNGCGMCVRSCPAGAISLAKGRPQWSFDCEGCQRCINSCPRHAVQTSVVRLVVLLAWELLSLAAFIWLFFIPYRNYFMDSSLGSVRISGWWPGFIIALIGWALVFVVLGHYLLDRLVRAGERINALRPIFGASITRKHRRYLDPGFDPSETQRAQGTQSTQGPRY